MTQVELLKKARALIAEPENWIQRNMAQDRNGHVVSYKDRAACRFCAAGAIARAVDGFLDDPNFHELAAVLANCVGENMVTYNAYHSHSEVLAMFDAGIKYLEEKKENG